VEWVIEMRYLIVAFQAIVLAGVLGGTLGIAISYVALTDFDIASMSIQGFFEHWKKFISDALIFGVALAIVAVIRMLIIEKLN
jgi:hypothetical protein